MQRSYNASCGIEGSSTLICRKPRYSLTSTYSTVLLADRDAPSFTFKADGIALSVFGVRIDVLDALSGDCENAVQQNKVSTLLVVAAQAQMIFHNGETRGEVFMRTLAAKDSNSSDCWRGMDPPFGFEDLQLPFSQFLKMNLALKIWRRNSSHFQGSISWWDERKDLEAFCDQEPLLPSRSELDDYFAVFLALWPNSHDFDTKPLIDDPDFLENFWKPQVPYLTQLLYSCGARCLWVSREKYMGLASRSARQGDEVWILHGSKIPSVLRKRPDGSYEFQGEAYVHGLMNGEFFKGRNDLTIENIVLK